MDERSSRVFFGLCLLVLVWIGVYWMWQPRSEQEPVITIESQPVQISRAELPASSSTTEEIDERSNEQESELESNQKPESSDSRSIELIKPEYLEHVVQPNERFQSIARHYYGSINDWSVIAIANPRVDPQKLKPGMILRIPVDKNNIQGMIVGEESMPGAIQPHVNSQDSKVIEYVVRSGDSLSVISERFYGSSRHARFIFESNRDVLTSMDAISVGQLLRLHPLDDSD